MKKSSWFPLAAAALLLAAGTLVYSNGLTGPFIFDDGLALRDNPSIRSLTPIWRAMVAPPNNVFAGRPVINLSFAIDYALFGQDVRGYHATNVAIHLATTLVLFALLRRVLRLPRIGLEAGADRLALAAALLWEVHPLLTEAVDYTSCRTEGLMAFFFLLTLYLVVRGMESTAPRRWYAAAVVASAIGMGCKEVMAVAPVLLFVFDAIVVSDGFGDALRKRLGLYAALAATTLIVPVLLLRFVSFYAKTGGGAQRMTPAIYAMTELGVVAHYLHLAAWPYPLTIDYDDWPLARSLWDVWPQALLIAALVALTIWALARRKPAALLGCWFFLILAPTSSIIPLGTEVAAERRMYLPTIAVVVGVVVALYQFLRRARLGPRVGPRIALLLVSITAVALGLTTYWRNGDYASTLLIWSDAVAKRPNNSRALGHLARAYQDLGRFREAREVAERYVAIAPDDPRARAALGGLQIGEGQLDPAIVNLSAAVRIDPKDTLSWTNLGLALFRRGRVEDSIDALQHALTLDPNFVDAHVYLADALKSKGDVAGAKHHLEAALRASPEDADIRGRYEALQR